MRIPVVVAVIGVVLFFTPHSILAHCDTPEGPVAHDARLALEKGDPTVVLKWVPEEHEAEIREAFQATLLVRQAGPEAKALADRYFLETLVRVHRAGEGEPFAGLRPSGTVEPGLLAADEALQSGSVKELSRSLAAAVAQALERRFEAASERKKHAADSVEAGRAYVEAYVQYVHFVEGLELLVSSGSSHGNDPSAHAHAE